MSNRDKFREWISGHYNVRHPFNDILDFLLFSDELPVPYNLEDHTHSMSDIDNLQIALDGKADINHTHSYNDLDDLPSLFDGTWGSLSGKPSTFPAATHSHTWGDITGKPTTFSPSAHNHPISDVTNLQTELDGKIPKSPKAAARADVTTGTSGLAVTVLGLSVISAAALTRLDEYGAAINDILARLRSREIIAV